MYACVCMYVCMHVYEYIQAYLGAVMGSVPDHFNKVDLTNFFGVPMDMSYGYTIFQSIKCVVALWLKI